VRGPLGWASIVVTVLFIGGIQLIAIGAVGEYLGRLFIFYNKEPQFIVEKIIEKNNSSLVKDL
jgi:hypothetical protein